MLSGLIPGFGHSRVTRASPPIPVARAAAAGVVFYGLLALFPAITALVSSYALFADPATINDHLAALADILPAGAYSIVEDQIQRVLAKGEVKLGFAFAISLGLAVWSANSGMKAVIDALNLSTTRRRSAASSS